MKRLIVFFASALGALAAPFPTQQAPMPHSIYDFTMKDIDGKNIPLSTYKGKALLIVNVASRCGCTPQYKGLQTLFEKYGPKGLMVLGFPAHDFMEQEPGSDTEIKNFCELNYKVTFPLFS